MNRIGRTGLGDWGFSLLGSKYGWLGGALVRGVAVQQPRHRIWKEGCAKLP